MRRCALSMQTAKLMQAFVAYGLWHSVAVPPTLAAMVSAVWVQHACLDVTAGADILQACALIKLQSSAKLWHALCGAVATPVRS